MKAHPLNSYWSIGHVCHMAGATEGEVDAAARRLGLELADLSINGVSHFNIVVAESIRREIVRERAAAAASAN